MMKRPDLPILCLAASVLCMTPKVHATLLSYWNFNNNSVAYNSGTIGSFSTSAASYGETYNSSSIQLSSNTVNGTVFSGSNIYIDFSNLSLGVTQPVINGLTPQSNQATTSGSGGFGVFSDTSMNRVSGDTSTGGSLFISNPGGVENDHYITLALSSTGYSSTALSYVSRVTNKASYSVIWSYSLDGTTFTNLTTLSITGTSAFAAYNVDLSSLSATALDNQDVFYLRMTLSDTSGGSIAFDNIQLTGTAIPEPATCALLSGVGIFAFAVWRARTRRA